LAKPRSDTKGEHDLKFAALVFAWSQDEQKTRTKQSNIEELIDFID
jgi:hypothetical protein